MPIERLIEQLNTVKEVFSNADRLPPSLKDRISKEDYRRILNYFSENALRNSTIPTHFEKEVTKLPRAVNLIQDPISKELHLILEIKSRFIKSGKTIKDKKRAKHRQGGFKIGKKCVSLNTSLNYMNLVYSHNNEEFNLEIIKAESENPKIVFEKALSLGFQEKEIPISVPAVLTYPRSNKRKKDTKGTMVTSFYSPYFDYDLISYMKKQDYNYKMSNSISSGFPNPYFIRQILLAAALCEKAGITHQDIKPDNFLVDLDENQIKLCDFSQSYNAGVPEQNHYAYGTDEYASPEVLIYLNNQTCYKKKDKPLAANCINRLYNSPHPKNDTWATAITLYAIKTFAFPSHLTPFSKYFGTSNSLDIKKENVPNESKDLLSKLDTMLECERSKRFTPIEAFEALENTMLFFGCEKISHRLGSNDIPPAIQQAQNNNLEAGPADINLEKPSI